MLTITKSKLQEFVEEIKKDFCVFDCRKDILPIKQYFLPAEQTTFRESADGKISEPDKPEKFILLGMNLKDLEALSQLDEIMKNDNEDFFYWQKRKMSVVIGTIDEHFDRLPGGDIVLQFHERPMPDISNYKVLTPTDKGHNFIKHYKKFFEESIDASTNSPLMGSQGPSLGAKFDWQQSMSELLRDPELLANAVEWSRMGAPQIWEDLAKTCLGCGVCTYVCPLCYCFSIDDRVELTGNCSRCRKWDACTLPRFAQISGGFNFRKTIKERYYNWFYHKFVRNYREYGKSLCVGCGRCKHYCPARIDIL